MTTPQNPYQAPPQPQPQDAQAAGQPTPPQGFGAPTVPAQGYPAPPATGYPAPPVAPQGGKAAKAGKRFAGALGMRIVISLVAFAVIGGGYAIYDNVTGGADTAKVGDCVQNAGTDSSPDVHVISCSDPKAQYKVIAVKDGSDYNVCKDVPGVTAGYSQTGDRYTSAVVLCLGDK